MPYETLDEIRAYVNGVKDKIEEELIRLEKICMDGRNREERPVPIYLTKWRVKKPESVFLKTKRKNKSYRDLTDYGGMRLLCLFEKDIILVHDYLLGVLASEGYDLHECNIYNFGKDSDVYYALKKSEEKYFPGHTIQLEDKISGYKSIHYLIYTQNNFHIEIQLRTLVQDVWGELEHALSYKKGSVHPYIKKSFLLLSKELQNVDDLLSNLKDISKKELAGKKYSTYHDEPIFYFDYEDSLFPSLFTQDASIRDKYDRYREMIDEKVYRNEGVINVRNAFNELISLIPFDLADDQFVSYWLRMEDAFIMLCESRYDDAMKKYTEILESYPDRYCVYYRMGELYDIKEKSEEALNCYDMAKYYLEKNDKNNYQNRFRIKHRLAYTYWLLGEEYISIAIKEVEDAESICLANIGKGIFNEKVLKDLANNVCWYSLERYIVSDQRKDGAVSDKYYVDVARKFKKLEESIVWDDASPSCLDTAAWFYFHKYKRTKDVSCIKKSMDFALKMKGKSTSGMDYDSVNIQIDHIQEIMLMAQDVLNYKV